MKRAIGGVAFLVLAAGGQAQAQPKDPPLTPSPDDPAAPDESCPPPPAPPPPAPPPQAVQPAPAPVVAEAPIVTEPSSWIDTVGFGVSGGGGVDGFTDSSMNNVSGVGGSWNVRATLGTRSYLAVEGLYIGSAQGINALGLSSNAQLIGNGAQADVRLNATTDYVVQPFIYGGGAWRYYSLSNASNNVSDVSNSTNVFELPAGVGIAAKISGLMLDARGEYRWSWGGDMVPNLTGGSLNMNRWGVSGNIGYEF